MYVPDSIKDYYREPKRLSGLPAYVVLGVASVWTWAVWGVVALVVAMLLGVIIRLWGECRALSNQVEEAARLRGDLATLEGENARLEAEATRLRRELDSPSLELPHLVHAADDQLTRLRAVTKHRKLRQDGLGEWIVTSIASADPAFIRVTAHADRDAGLAAGEPALLVEVSGDEPVGGGEIAPTAGGHIELRIPLANLAEHLQEAVVNRAPLSRERFLVRLAWLHVEPYRSLTNEEIEALIGHLDALSGDITQSLSRSTIRSLEGPV